MLDKMHALTEHMTLAATELGIGVIHEIARQVLVHKPGLSAKQLLQVLDEQVEVMRQHHLANKNKDI